MPRPQWNPFICSRTPMAPNALLMAKLALLLLFATGFPAQIGEPFAPVFPVFDLLRAVPGIDWLLQIVFAFASVCLLLNVAVRIASIVLGGIVLLVLAQTLPAFEAHRLLAGLVLLFCGLQKAREPPRLVRWLVALELAYLVLSHPFSHGWTQSVVLEGWIHESVTYPVYTFLCRLLSPAIVTTTLAWVTMIVALLAAAGLTRPRFQRIAVGLAVALHIGIYFVIGTKPVGAFSIAMSIACLAFLNWPEQGIEVLWPRACGWPIWVHMTLDKLDWDERLEWPFPENPDADLEVVTNGVRSRDWRALVTVLSYFPAFHFAIFGALITAQLALPEPFSAIAQLLIAIALLFFFALPGLRRRVRPEMAENDSTS